MLRQHFEYCIYVTRFNYILHSKRSFLHTHHTHTLGLICYYLMVSIEEKRMFLISSCDIIVLSNHTEPTNMLDIRAVLWLEQYLKVGKGSLFISTHIHTHTHTHHMYLSGCASNKSRVASKKMLEIHLITFV